MDARFVLSSDASGNLSADRACLSCASYHMNIFWTDHALNLVGGGHAGLNNNKRRNSNDRETGVSVSLFGTSPVFFALVRACGSVDRRCA